VKNFFTQILLSKTESNSPIKKTFVNERYGILKWNMILLILQAVVFGV